ncbi:MAG: oxidoreductase [Janthinobacterium lividum]
MTLGRGLIRVGLVGYGFVGRTFHAPLIGAVEGLSLDAVASSDAGKVRADLPRVTIYPRPEELLKDHKVDLVVIATPNETHAPLTLAALRAGKHVMLDKPFALDLREARELVAEASRAQRLLCVFHNRRWDSDFLTVQAAIKAGTIGRVTHFESTIDRFRPQVRDRWRERAMRGGGVWFDLGPHLVDQALQLFGLPDRVLASLACQRDSSLIDDWAHVILFYGEQRVILHTGMLAAGRSPRFVVHGTSGSLVKQAADQQELQLIAGMRPGDAGWGEDPDPIIIHGGDGALRQLPAVAGDQQRIYAGLVAALNGEGDNPVFPIEALAVTGVIEAAIISARDGVTVGLRLTEEECQQWHRKHCRDMTELAGLAE